VIPQPIADHPGNQQQRQHHQRPDRDQPAVVRELLEPASA
jgi:hypothetical protein